MKGMLSFFLLWIVGCGISAELAFAEKKKKVSMPKDPPGPSKREEGDFVVEKKGNTTIKYKKKTKYDFEGASVEGIYNKPAGAYISNIKDVKARTVIPLRENFDAEVIDSARLIK